MSVQRSRFVSLFREEYADVAEQCFGYLQAHYAEPHRHYHTLAHVEACLKHLDSIPVDELPDCRRELELALWFHDVIYNPKQQDNEAQSADFAVRWLQQLQEPDSLVQAVQTLILLTRHPSTPTTRPEKYLLDIDLSILGVSADRYAEYERWIRQEYRFAPGFLYRRGRIRVLQGFLEQDCIYHTDRFRQQLERQARVNLGNAIHACL